MNEYQTILNNTKVKDIITPFRELYYINHDETVNAVFKKLSEEKITGIFVVENEKPIGFVDMYDLLIYLVYELNGLSDGDIGSLDLDDVFASADKFEGYTARDIINLSLVDEFDIIDDEMSVFEAMKRLTEKKHRVAVSTDGIVMNILSQLDIIYFITQCRDFVSMIGVPLESQPHIVGKEVASVHKDTKLIFALLSCFENRVSALAVVDDHGKIVGNLSASDLIGITNENVSLLGMSVHDYLIYEGKPMKPAVTIRPTDNLELAYLKITAYKIHRVYVVNEENMPIGVLSLTDLIKLNVENLWKMKFL